MASLYRPTITRFLDSKGRQVPKGTTGARRVRQKAKTIWGRYNANGVIKRVSLSDDRDLAETMLGELVKRAKREAAGDIDPFEDHRKRPLAEHLNDFEAALIAKAVTDHQSNQVVARCRKIIAGCGFKKLTDLSPSAVANYLRERRQEGLSIQTSNHYLAAVKAFANWLVKDRRILTNPLTHLAKLNAKVDIRHERRALSSDELARLVQATEQSQESFRGLDGTTRGMLYRIATLTGLRASELASLTSASFDLTNDPPIVTLEAAYSKHRREDVLPLHPDLVIRLRQWFTVRERLSGDSEVILSMDRGSSAKPERLFPGTWTEKAAKMLRADLEAARVQYETEEGFCDFHSLRHTFISNLVSAGVHPKVAQQLARHSSIALTMDRYTHLGLIDMTAGLSGLPTIAAADANQCRATGTTDMTGIGSILSCTKSCNAPVQLNRSEPLSTASPISNPADSHQVKNPQIHGENEGFRGKSGVHPAGLEPATFGSVDRCSIQLS